jgi:hypothetical protein
MCWRRPRARIARAPASACEGSPRAGWSRRTAPVTGGLWQNLREKSRALRNREKRRALRWRRRAKGGAATRSRRFWTADRALEVDPERQRIWAAPAPWRIRCRALRLIRRGPLPPASASSGGRRERGTGRPRRPQLKNFNSECIPRFGSG